ncbi:hypothetical protein ACHB4O_002442 [Listeria innocua]|nr:hypothetical protein [Listeria innocua]
MRYRKNSGHNATKNILTDQISRMQTGKNGTDKMQHANSSHPVISTIPQFVFFFRYFSTLVVDSLAPCHEAFKKSETTSSRINQKKWKNLFL